MFSLKRAFTSVEIDNVIVQPLMFKQLHEREPCNIDSLYRCAAVDTKISDRFGNQGGQRILGSKCAFVFRPQLTVDTNLGCICGVNGLYRKIYIRIT